MDNRAASINNMDSCSESETDFQNYDRMSDQNVHHSAEVLHNRELPPPYTVNNPGQFPILVQPLTISNSSLAHSNNNLSLHSVSERHACLESLRTVKHLFVKLAGKAVGGTGTLNIEKQNGDILFYDKVSAFGAEHSIVDPVTGKTIIRLHQELSNIQVELLGKRLGFIQNNNTVGKSYSITSIVSGDSNFLIQGSNTFGLSYFPGLTKGEFSILSNSETIGFMNKTFGNFGISIPEEKDTNSKILLLAAAIIIFIGYFADSGCSSGIRGVNCFCCNLAIVSRF